MPRFIVRKSDFEAHRDKALKDARVIKTIRRGRYVVIECSEEVLRRAGIWFARDIEIHHHGIEVTLPLQTVGLEQAIFPHELRALTVDPLIFRLGGFIDFRKIGIKVAVLDTGVNDHTIFEMNDVKIVERITVVENTDVDDKVGHGTHVAGIIATIAPHLDLLSIKVLGDNGRGTLSDLIEGIDKAVELGAKVINMSLGGQCSKEEVELLDEALKDAVDNGVVPVAASGNESMLVVDYPARSGYAIAVGSINKFLITSYFTNIEPTVKKPEFMAFGEDVYSASNKDPKALIALSGTSMATPVVSALACYFYAFYLDAKEKGAKEVRMRSAMDFTGLELRLEGETVFDIVRSSMIRTFSVNNIRLFGDWNMVYGYGIASFRRLIAWM